MTLPQSAVDLLNHPKAHASIVTLNSDGSPQVTLVWAEPIEGGLSFNTALQRQKARNLKRDPRIAVSVQDPENPRQYAVFHGTARLVEGGADEQIDRLAKKYLGQDRYPAHSAGEDRVRIDVAVQRVQGMGPWAQPQG